eukprot:comp18051_c0_seq1/m.31555 comp18051_c0_seq1/g.31555  ORF comp18051_c0_seq1/g.31555 comp18051_c0_seq1/m.31555 type:complete len:304 (+) comp18051_c0_seq1:618-1529(+)
MRRTTTDTVRCMSPAILHAFVYSLCMAHRLLPRAWTDRPQCIAQSQSLTRHLCLHCCRRAQMSMQQPSTTGLLYTRHRTWEMQKSSKSCWPMEQQWIASQTRDGQPCISLQEEAMLKSATCSLTHEQTSTQKQQKATLHCTGPRAAAMSATSPISFSTAQMSTPSQQTDRPLSTGPPPRVRHLLSISCSARAQIQTLETPTASPQPISPSRRTFATSSFPMLRVILRAWRHQARSRPLALRRQSQLQQEDLWVRRDPRPSQVASAVCARSTQHRPSATLQPMAQSLPRWLSSCLSRSASSTFA